MKIRNGFVSNSSSSSFVIKFNDYEDLIVDSVCPTCNSKIKISILDLYDIETYYDNPKKIYNYVKDILEYDEFCELNKYKKCLESIKECIGNKDVYVNIIEANNFETEFFNKVLDLEKEGKLSILYQGEL